MAVVEFDPGIESVRGILMGIFFQQRSCGLIRKKHLKKCFFLILFAHVDFFSYLCGQIEDLNLN